METGISNKVVAVLSLGSGDESFMKTIMTNKVRKILSRLKLGLRLPAKSAGLFRKDGVHLITNFKPSLTFDIQEIVTCVTSSISSEIWVNLSILKDVKTCQIGRLQTQTYGSLKKT